jgi:quinol monooxygenase YgiN
MSSSMSWLLQVTINDGQLDAFKALMVEMVASTEAEAGAHTYEWFISDDEAEAHMYERYADNEAMMTHLGNFGANFAERFLAACTPGSFNVYGEADDATREAVAAFGANHYATLGGFAR